MAPARRITAPIHTRLALGPGGGALIHVVEDGLLRPVAITADGREFGLGLLGPGQAFLQPDGEARPGLGFYVEALEDSRCLVFTRAELPELPARDPQAAAQLLQALSGGVADLSELCASLCLEAAPERLLRLLRRLAERHGTREAGAVRLRLRQQDLALMAGLCRETVNATLHALAAAGRVRLGRQSIWVPTP